MRATCLLTLLVVSLPLQAETWECKTPIEQIPWTTIDLTAETVDTGLTSIQIGDKEYAATFFDDGTARRWILKPNEDAGLTSGVLIIDLEGRGLMRREFLMNGVIVHSQSEYVCRTAEEDVE